MPNARIEQLQQQLKKLEKLRQRLDNLREQGQVRSRELESLAKAVGRTFRAGKHPVYKMPGRPPLPIAHHSEPMKRHTKDGILDVLDGDIAAQEELVINELDRQSK